jgi:hypothetical protein
MAFPDEVGDKREDSEPKSRPPPTPEPPLPTPPKPNKGSVPVAEPNVVYGEPLPE